MPTLLHGPGCNLAEWYGVPSSCALLGGLAIGAWASLLQHSAEREMSASACTRSMPGCYSVVSSLASVSESETVRFVYCCSYSIQFVCYE